MCNSLQLQRLFSEIEYVFHNVFLKGLVQWSLNIMWSVSRKSVVWLSFLLLSCDLFMTALDSFNSFLLMQLCNFIYFPRLRKITFAESYHLFDLQLFLRSHRFWLSASFLPSVSQFLQTDNWNALPWWRKNIFAAFQKRKLRKQDFLDKV